MHSEAPRLPACAAGIAAFRVPEHVCPPRAAPPRPPPLFPPRARRESASARATLARPGGPDRTLTVWEPPPPPFPPVLTGQASSLPSYLLDKPRPSPVLTGQASSLPSYLLDKPRPSPRPHAEGVGGHARRPGPPPPPLLLPLPVSLLYCASQAPAPPQRPRPQLDHRTAGLGSERTAALPQLFADAEELPPSAAMVASFTGHVFGPDACRVPPRRLAHRLLLARRQRPAPRAAPQRRRLHFLPLSSTSC